MNLTYVSWPGELTDAFSELAGKILDKEIPIDIYKTEQIKSLTGVPKQHHYRHLYKHDSKWNNIIPKNYIAIFDKHLTPVIHTISEIKIFTFDNYSSLPLHVDIGRHCVINFPIKINKEQKLLVLNREMQEGEIDLYIDAKADGTWNEKRNQKLESLGEDLVEREMKQCAILNTKVWHTVINKTADERIQIAFEPHRDFYYKDIVKLFKDNGWA